eukprot:TRINITY_DN17668_c0_g1_i2.p1 TRINITY_DN17668_c0_g1~~TRINITY_DN17668_c0_g1_i2.p1  ORF type:complete len:158 (+),score=4.97 TRINITY_DN17668_c0_g1_i2:34-474(+)
MEAIVCEITLNYIPTHLHHWHFFLSGMVSGRYCLVGQTGLHILPNAPSKPARASRMSSPWCSRRVHSYGMLMSHGSEQLFMVPSSYIQKLAFLIPFHSLMKSTLLSLRLGSPYVLIWTILSDLSFLESSENDSEIGKVCRSKPILV